jgi:hypothetical protein
MGLQSAFQKRGKAQENFPEGSPIIENLLKIVAAFWMPKSDLRASRPDRFGIPP